MPRQTAGRQWVLFCKLTARTCLDEGSKPAQNNHPDGGDLQGGSTELRRASTSLCLAHCASATSKGRFWVHALVPRRCCVVFGGAQERQRVHLL